MRLGVILATMLAAWPAMAVAQASGPLTTTPGDAALGESIVSDRQKGLCLLCHSGPFPEVMFQGDLAPSLAGIGARLTEAELRQRLVDSRTLNPDTIMPPYFATDGLVRVGEHWSDTTILTAQEIEDVVAFLATLTEEPR